MMSLPDNEQALGKKRGIATFPGRCPVGRSLGIEKGELGVAGTEIVTDVRP